jgi:MerR family transcriptional regulator, light-induced transcriptional regulator
VLLAAGPGEAHILPLVALAAALAERDVASVVAGELPRQALTEAIGQLRPHVVVLWSRAAATARPGLLTTAAELVDDPSSVWAAGPGWNPRGLPSGVGHLFNLPDALAAALPASVHLPAPADGQRCVGETTDQSRRASSA